MTLRYRVTTYEEELDKISNYIVDDGVAPQETTVTEANDDDATFSAGIAGALI